VEVEAIRVGGRASNNYAHTVLHIQAYLLGLGSV
jgi:hypothetical protein